MAAIAIPATVLLFAYAEFTKPYTYTYNYVHTLDNDTYYAVCNDVQSITDAINAAGDTDTVRLIHVYSADNGPPYDYLGALSGIKRHFDYEPMPMPL